MEDLRYTTVEGGKEKRWMEDGLFQNHTEEESIIFGALLGGIASINFIG